MDKSTVLPDSKTYRMREEVAHSITHGVGTILAIAGMVTLISYAAASESVQQLVACCIFGATLVLLYSVSTLYHSVQRPRAKKILREMDHASIYLLIAGSYTPFTLVNLQETWGWYLFGLAWGLAVLGIALQFTPLRRFYYVRLILYLTMGWTAVLAIKPLAASVPPNALTLLVAGGVAYTTGVIFYLWHRLPYHHAIWHVFVLSGSALHFFAVLASIRPPSA